MKTGVVILMFVCASSLVAELSTDVQRDTRWLSENSSRVVGTPGHRTASARLLKQIQSLGVQVWTHEFETIMPVTERAELHIPNPPPDLLGGIKGEHGGNVTIPVHPLIPASARLNTSTSDGIHGRLIYVKSAKPGEVPARSLRGQIAVMELAGKGRWQTAYNAGANAIVLLGTGNETFLDIQSHFLPIPINVPRFYVPPGFHAHQLRRGESLSGRLTCNSSWQSVRARNIYALVRPTDRKTPRPALAIMTPIDSSGVVPAMAPGADAAVDSAFALNVLKHFAQHPPARPLLFAFVDAYSVNQLGVRKFLTGVRQTSSEQRGIRQADKELLDEYSNLTDTLARLEAVSEPWIDLHKSEFKSLHQAVRHEVGREIIAIETTLNPLRLKLSLLKPEDTESIKATIDEQSARRARFFAAQNQMLTRDAIDPQNLELVKELWSRARARLAGQQSAAAARAAEYAARDKRQAEMLTALGLPSHDDDGNEMSPVDFVLGIDLSDAGVAVGPITFCNHWRTSEAKNFASMRNWLTQHSHHAEGVVPLWSEDVRSAVSLSPITGIDSGSSYAVGQMPSMTAITRSFGVEGMTWSTLDALRSKIDTPFDTFDNLDWQRLGPQIWATFQLLKRLAADKAYLPRRATPKWNRVSGAIVDQLRGDAVPKLPMHGYLTTMIHGSSRAGRAGYNGYPPSPGLRRQEFVFTEIDGRFYFEAMPGHLDEWGISHLYAQSYLIGSDGSILRSLDMKKIGKGVTVAFDLRSSRPTPIRAMPFTCESIQALGLFDPRFLSDLYSATLLDSRRGSEPQRMNFSLTRGMMTCQLEHGLKWQLILRAGISKNRMALLGMMPPESAGSFSVRASMRGFSAAERLPLHPVHLSARDLTYLDERRLGDYRRAGITSKAIQELRKDSAALLADAEDAIERDDGAALFRAATGAMANEVRAYQAVRDTANDVIRGAIVLLLLLVPFSFATERLLIASPFIYRQIAGGLGIFSLMCAILWSFHPAFRITSQPLIIVMSFAIIFMSLLVLSVVFSKFESGLEEMRSGLATASGASTSRYGLLVTAIQLGIANMRKRKFRTAMTGITIMLITFALLCFMSASSYSGHREVSLPMKSRFTGVLIRQPSMRPLPERSLEYLENVLGEDRVLSARFWWGEMLDPQWRLHIRHASSGNVTSLEAGLGLSPHEAELTAVRDALPNWDEFKKGTGCYLSKNVADGLGARPGDNLIVAGKSLRLTGVYEPRDFDRTVLDLDGQPLLPYDFSAIDEDQRKSMRNVRLDQASIEMESGVGLSPDVDLPRLSSESFIIVPVEPFRGIPNFTLRNLAGQASGADDAKSLAYELAKRLAFPIYYGTESGIRVLATTPLLPKARKSIIIPLIIGGLIIFNTMLSSLAERRREIYIYTSLGLAPLHIGFLFLAEAVTYGLLGSIFGYVVGQGVATLFTSLGWMGNLTLNYSGSQAIATMLLVIGVVIFSSLVPAILAGRLAAPSNEMNWSVPIPDGDTMRDTLPFTVSGQTANGVMAYMLEYMDAHREGGIGNFSTDDLRMTDAGANGVGTADDSGNDHLIGIESTVWLAPYDLGVRQHVRLTVLPTDEGDIYEIGSEMTRESGQTSSWVKLNRVFLGDLRRQLLGWRNLKLERMLEYIAKATEESTAVS